MNVWEPNPRSQNGTEEQLGWGYIDNIPNVTK